MHLDILLALGLFATSVGCGWLVYRGRIARDAAQASANSGADPMEVLHELRSQTLVASREAGATATRIVETVRAGVR